MTPVATVILSDGRMILMSLGFWEARMRVSFTSKLIRPNIAGAWTFVLVPRLEAIKAGFRARMRVKGTIEGTPFRSSLIPRGGGEVFVVVNSELRDRIHKSKGGVVRLELGLDPSPAEIREPLALRRALARDPRAKSVFNSFTPSQRRAYVRWIAAAKQDATRDRRVATAVERLRRGEKLN
jgi:hypothetical protein